MVLALTALVYLPCLDYGFVNWDDDVLVTRNPYVQALTAENLKAMASRTLTDAYHPLTFLSYALDHRVWGLSPFGYHLTNLLAHVLTTALVMRWVLAVEGSLAAAVAATLFFSLHPMRVEAVAWVSGRKDLLAGMFFMASLLAFERWRTAGARRWYPAALALFACAGLSKATAVTLPPP